MNFRISPFQLQIALTIGLLLPLRGASILGPSTQVYSIDLDSDSFVVEGAESAIDGPQGLDYANLGGLNSGVILDVGSSFAATNLEVILGSSREVSDPTSYLILGSNDTTINTSNPTAISNGWTLVSSGSLTLSSPRDIPTVVPFQNKASFSSYWVIFPTLEGGASPFPVLEIGDVYLSDERLNGREMMVGAIPTGTSWQGGFPASSPTAAVDQVAVTNYFNSGGVNSGVVVYPTDDFGHFRLPSNIRSFTITSASNLPQDDPAGYTLYGQDRSGVWRAIQSGVFSADQMPLERGVTGAAIGVNNSTSFQAYSLVATSLRDGSTATGLQFGDIQFYDTVPEPSSAALALMSIGLVSRRRRN